MNDNEQDNPSVPAGGDTDSAAATSWRAEVVESALEEDAAKAVRHLVYQRRAQETVLRRAMLRFGWIRRVSSVVYTLASDVVVFDDQIYRVIDLGVQK